MMRHRDQPQPQPQPEPQQQPQQQQDMEERVREAERGYCVEWLGDKICLRPAVAIVQVSVSGPGRLQCEQHVLGWPDSIVMRLD